MCECYVHVRGGRSTVQQEILAGNFIVDILMAYKHTTRLKSINYYSSYLVGGDSYIWQFATFTNEAYG